MAVAEKQITEAVPRRPLNRLAVNSLLGALYVLGSIYLVFYGLHHLWYDTGWYEALGFQSDSYVLGALLILVKLVAATGLIVLGVRLHGPEQPHGFRAGVFFDIVLIFLVVWLTFTTGRIFEGQFTAAGETPVVEIALTALLGAVYLFFAFRIMFSDAYNAWLGRVEDKGWFHAHAFKPTQGQRVRRGTIIALLALVACGVYTMLSHRLLPPDTDWRLTIPFTSTTEVVRTTVTEPGAAPGTTVTREVNETWIHYRYIPILPDVRYTFPVILLGLMIWLSWRIVNYPTFADFLIATEAELNKVSWTTRKRLYQDTVVVLVTVFLLTVFLFVVDALWIKILSNPFVRVLQIDIQAEQTRLQQSSQW
jgi:preprotein translocase SecE subunit